MRIRDALALFMMLVCASASAHSVVERDGYYEVAHSWRHEGESCSVRLNVPADLYGAYRNGREHVAYRYQFEGREAPPNYFGFMLSENDRDVMRSLAEAFGANAATQYGRIGLALSFVQSLAYASDAATKGVDEYVRFPVETLVDGCGDCEDKVVLLAALLYEMKADYIVLALPDHLALGVHCDGVHADHYLLFRDRRYYYMETTTEGWHIGDIPEPYRSAKMEAVPVDATPRLLIRSVRFDSQPAAVFEKALCRLQVTLHNQGPGSVAQVALVARVVQQGKQPRLLAEQYYLLNDLKEGEKRTERLALKSLIRENCLVQVELLGDNMLPQRYEMALDYSRTRH